MEYLILPAQVILFVFFITSIIFFICLAFAKYLLHKDDEYINKQKEFYSYLKNRI